MGVTPRPVNTAGTTFNPLVFIKEVARYFMDFLETDFHKQKTPKRAVRFRNPDNLLVGVSADKYPTFGAAVWKLVNRSFAKGVLDHIGKEAFRTPIPENLLELVRLQVSKLSTEQVARVVAGVARELENAATLYSREYDRALSVTLDAIEKRVEAATLRAERLTQAILAKAFRGELVPTEAELARREGREYEPASVLLERIRKEREKAGAAKPKRGKKIAKH
jgi:hypothetical protein